MFSADLGGGGTPVDPNFKQVALLLHGDGTNGAQNNTFVDSSTNNFTITRTGNVAQGTFSPFSLAEGQWSNYFDGSGDWLTIPYNANLTMGNNDFTIELWYYPNSFSSYQLLLTQDNGNNSNQNFQFRIDASGIFSYIFWTTSSRSSALGINSSTALTLNSWNHLAVSYTSTNTTTRLFLNGTQVGSSTSAPWNSSTYGGQTAIGNFTSDIFQTAAYAKVNGYISNIRMVKGTAVYTSNFTPPTAPLTAVSGTSLLTCQSNRFVDNSANNFTITPAGDTKVTAFSPFAPSAAYSASTNGGSGYFDGNGDYLSAADNANLRFGTKAFTIQAWVYRNAAGTAHSIVSKGGASTGFTLGITSTNILRFTDTTTNIDTTTTIPAGTWTHVAAVRTNTSTNGFQLYIDGVSSKTATVSTDFNQTDTLYVGADRGAANVMNGYITNLQYVNGTALTITVPTAPLTAVTNTQLLLNCTNAGIIDNSGKNDIETVGNAQISTSVKKYGTGSLAFDGNGDWLTIPATPNLYLGSGDFTVECWIYQTSSTGVQYLISQTTGTFSKSQFDININAGNIAGIVYYGGSYVATATTAVTSNTWTHIAFVRSGSNLVIYKNGVSSGTGTIGTNTLNSPTGEIRVGALNNATPYAYIGYIDDLRITKGQALYTSNFTPPTAALPTY